MKTARIVVVLAVAVLAGAAVGRAQQAPAPPPETQTSPPDRPRPPAPPAMIVPLRVDITLDKYQGDRRVSRTPYSLSVNTNTGKSSVRMGAEVPVSTVVGGPAQSPDGQAVPRLFQYRLVGTNIDCFAQTRDGMTYRLSISIEDTSVYAADDSPATVAGAPTLRTFKSSNEISLLDGQSEEFVAATDKVSGEVIRVAVKLTVLK